MTLNRRAALARAGALATAVLAGCAGGDGRSEPTTELPEGPIVEVGPNNRFAFVPGTDEPLTVAADTTVTWVWKSNTHNIHVDSQPDGADWPGHENVQNAGFTHSYTFDVPGRYHYWCVPHRSAGMVAELVVE